jgi:hypothetical protein
VQRRQPLGDQVLVRREAVVRQRFPVGQQTHAQFRGEPGDLFGQTLRIDGMGADDGHHRRAAAMLRA